MIINVRREPDEIVPPGNDDLLLVEVAGHPGGVLAGKAYGQDGRALVVVLRGDVTDRELFREERLHEADFMVVATGDEERNVLISLLAKRLGVKRTITRVRTFGYISVISALGIDMVVSTHLAAIDATLQFIRKGKVLSVAALKGDHAEVVEVVAQESSRILKKPLKSLKFPRGALIGAIVRGEEVIIPSGLSRIESGDRVLIFVAPESILDVEKFLMV